MIRRSSTTWAAALLAVSSCGGTDSPPAPPEADAPSTWFTDATDEALLTFRHRHGGSGRKYLVETNGSGAAWLDANGDARLDAYLVQGGLLPGTEPAFDARNRLLLQTDDGRFEDATEVSRTGDEQHGMAAIAADFDNDGDTDLAVTNWGTDVLYRNDGTGRFDDVSTAAGVAGTTSYSSSAAWVDLDRDGALDLYVVQYLDWSLENHPPCGHADRGPEYLSYCHPEMFQGLDDRLYRNQGDGTFEDVSVASGLQGSGGKGLGVVAGDIDDDGDPDLFVANDSTRNHLWRNDGSGGLTDIAFDLGVAFNGHGAPEACMGCDIGDIDGDLDLDLFTVNLAGETNTLWIRQGDRYRDRSYVSGLAAPSEHVVGFGTVLADLDLDGALDVAVANGHVLDNASLFDPKTSHAQPAHLFQGDGKGRFTRVAADEAGTYFGERHVGRGLARADVDEDGDLDLLFTNNNGTARLLRNHASRAHAWIGFHLEGRRSSRDALGARITLHGASAPQVRHVQTGGSYLSSHDGRVLFGLGPRETAPSTLRVEIRWPQGDVQELADLAPDTYHHIVEESR